jgi:hypothetical protein
MAAYRSPSKNTGKLKLQPILNRNSPWPHTESKLGILRVTRKLMNIHSSLKIIKLKYTFLLTSYPNSIGPVFGLKEF